MENISDTSEDVLLSSMVIFLENEEAAEKILKLMRQKHPSILVLCNEEHPTEALNDSVCQHVAEQGLKEILDTIKSKPIQDDHLYAGSVLVSIKDIHIVKKYIWKDNDFIPAMSRLLKHKIIDNKNKMFRDIVACIIQGTILGGTPAVFFETIAMSDIIEIYTGIFTNRSEVLFKQSYEKIILSLLIMCQNHDSCLHKCKQLDTAKSLEQFSQWELLEDEIKEKAQVASQCIQHMSNQDQLPDYKKVVLNKFSDHMHAKNKTYKRMETVVCSYSDCSKIQPVTKEGRFKKCGRCRVVLYCSKECQKAHWINSHSKVCVAPADVK